MAYPETSKINDSKLANVLIKAANAIIKKDYSGYLQYECEIASMLSRMPEIDNNDSIMVIWRIQLNCISEVLSKHVKLINDPSKWMLLKNVNYEKNGLTPDWISKIFNIDVNKIVDVCVAIVPEPVGIYNRLVYTAVKIKTGIFSSEWKVLGLPLVPVKSRLKGDGKIREDLVVCIRTSINKYRKSKGLPEKKW